MNRMIRTALLVLGMTALAVPALHLLVPSASSAGSHASLQPLGLIDGTQPPLPPTRLLAIDGTQPPLPPTRLLAIDGTQPPLPPTKS
jgi:hypothetical protein